MRDYMSRKKGFKHTPETLEKMKNSVNKGQFKQNNKSREGLKHSKETKQKIRDTLKKKGIKPPVKSGKESHLYGKNLSPERVSNMSGENNYNWQGGITDLNHQIRNNFKNKALIIDILRRDNYTCQLCKQVGGKLHVHHIKLFSTILKENNIQSLTEAIHCNELWNLDNGITLCKKCHKREHKMKNNKEKTGRLQ